MTGGIPYRSVVVKQKRNVIHWNDKWIIFVKPYYNLIVIHRFLNALPKRIYTYIYIYIYNDYSRILWLIWWLIGTPTDIMMDYQIKRWQHQYITGMMTRMSIILVMATMMIHDLFHFELHHLQTNRLIVYRNAI